VQVIWFIIGLIAMIMDSNDEIVIYDVMLLCIDECY
jgi:hypothetical protein